MSRARRPYGRARRILGPPFEVVYRAVVARRNAIFDAGTGVRRVPQTVISVGNLTTGGTGKSPAVIWLAQALQRDGVRPAIAMRGYKSADGRSDEAEQYRARLPGVPVLVGPNRYATIRRELAADDPSVVILDDGFQHRALARDLDIVLIDAMEETPSDRLLPTGDLREPLSSLARADVIIFTHAVSADRDRLAVQVQRVTACAGAGRAATRPPAIVTTASHEWVSLEVTENGATRTEPVSWLAGRPVALVCGIGKPERFVAGALLAGAQIGNQTILRDHAPITELTVGRVAGAAALHNASILLTEKDFARLGSIPSEWARFSVVRPRLAFVVDGEERVLESVRAAISARTGADRR